MGMGKRTFKPLTIGSQVLPGTVNPSMPLIDLFKGQQIRTQIILDEQPSPYSSELEKLVNKSVTHSTTKPITVGKTQNRFETLTQAVTAITTAAIAAGLLKNSDDIQAFLIQTYKTMTDF